MNTINNHKLVIAVGALAVTPGAPALSVPGFGLIAGVAGTATITTGEGLSVVVPLAIGVPVYIEHTHVTAATATGIVSLH